MGLSRLWFSRVLYGILVLLSWIAWSQKHEQQNLEIDNEALSLTPEG